jgi:hypothetical protein
MGGEREAREKCQMVRRKCNGAKCKFDKMKNG